MTILVLLALCGLVAKLWADVGALRSRVGALETGAVAQPAVSEAPSQVFAWQEAEPLPAPQVTARVVRTVPAPEPPPVVSEKSVAVVEREPRVPVVEVVEPPLVTGRTEQEALSSPDAFPHDAPAQPRRSLGFEDIFGRKLPIWAGGVTLAVCGFLIVKYSIDAGLLSPLVRVIFGLLFGTGLIAGAEVSLRQEHRVRDPRVRQALAGAGVATLYASVLVAANLYALVPPLVAFAGLALVTLLAAFLSLRFGAPSAVLGLVGGLAAPALVGTGEPNVPLLAGYLALAVGGLATLGRAQRWWWLGAAALVGGFGWGAVLLLTGALSIADSLSIGAFLLLLGVGLPVLLFDGGAAQGSGDAQHRWNGGGGAQGPIVRLLGTLAAAAQLAALVATGGFTMLHWSLFGLLGLASVWLSRRERALADLPIPALVITLLLLTTWPTPIRQDFALVIGGAAAIFGLPAAWRVWRVDGRLSDASAVAALAASALLPWWRLDHSDTTATALSLAGAGAAAGIAAFGWRVESRRKDARFVVLTATAATLLALAAAFGLPERAVAPAWAAIAAGLVLLAGRARDLRVERFAWAAGFITIAAYTLVSGEEQALSHALGISDHPFLPVEALRWAVGAGAAWVFAHCGKLRGATSAGSVAAVLFGYVAVAQGTPASLLPLIPAIGVALLGWFRRPIAAIATAGVLAGSWAAWPLVEWLAGAGGALVGVPLFVTALPSAADTATRLLAPTIAAALMFWRYRPTERPLRLSWLATLGLLGGATAHIAYKHLFAIPDTAAFIRLGMAERTLWEALLAVAAVALHKRAPNAAAALGAAALAHLAWFTLILHDPLWSEQAVGALPVVNLLLPAYALGFALLWAAGKGASLPPIADRARDWAQMALVLLFATSELRQLTHGSFLAHGDVGEAEDIARSVLAIAVAIGFLQWGIRRSSRDWRIASLVVMLGAVAKVFLFDASGLDGLLRIASFAALGFSLIGIGWLYNRYLPDADAAVNPPSALA